jgi:hypothetical protein
MRFSVVHGISDRPGLLADARLSFRESTRRH